MGYFDTKSCKLRQPVASSELYMLGFAATGFGLKLSRSFGVGLKPKMIRHVPWEVIWDPYRVLTL